MSRAIKIYDTTLRDGTQSGGVSLSMEDKARIAQRLDALGECLARVSIRGTQSAPNPPRRISGPRS